MEKSKKRDIKDLEKKIGYVFKDKALLYEALTHSSYANELSQRNIPTRSNERLEFLGDSVLEILASTYLFTEYPNVPEGELTRLRSEAICTAALSSYATEIELGEYLLLGNGERKCNGNKKPTTLENAFEALLGAMYLDSNRSLKTLRAFVLPFLTGRISVAECDITDYKSELQQIIQQTPGEVLTYEEISKVGPDNDPTFTVVAKLNSNVIGSGKGHSKKKAEQSAAKDAMLKFFKKQTEK